MENYTYYLAQKKQEYLDKGLEVLMATVHFNPHLEIQGYGRGIQVVHNTVFIYYYLSIDHCNAIINILHIFQKFPMGVLKYHAKNLLIVKMQHYNCHFFCFCLQFLAKLRSIICTLLCQCYICHSCSFSQTRNMCLFDHFACVQVQMSQIRKKTRNNN